MKERDGQTDNPNTVCWGGNAWGLWEHGGEDLTQSGETTRFPGGSSPDLGLVQAPHWADDMPHHRELKIEKDTKP